MSNFRKEQKELLLDITGQSDVMEMEFTEDSENMTRENYDYYKTIGNIHLAIGNFLIKKDVKKSVSDFISAPLP